MSKELPAFSIRQLFERNDSYVIPIYQRNYAWGQGEVAQLIQDVYDYAFSKDENQRIQNYYIGTLVVYERVIDGKTFYETIDGQQRLTTLNIVLNAIHRLFGKTLKAPIQYRPNLNFDSRKKSTATLLEISSGKDALFSSGQEYNSNIKQRFFDSEKVLKSLLKTSEDQNVFYEYLTDKVHVVRVPVPAGTDLNHYFEIMNNRGEQLEKHEVLKAKLQEILKDSPQESYAFNLIWEACSDMERYVQYGFSTEQRNALFKASNWNTLVCRDFDEILRLLHNTSATENSANDQSIEDIVQHKGAFQLNKDHVADTPERFSSVINFSNFLLHVLRIQMRSDISLDDKRLIDLFQPFYQEGSLEERRAFVKEFGFSLLKAKHLFDQFIIKREFIGEKDQWSLKRLKWYEKNKVSYVGSFEIDEANREVLMLLAMFHVSAPTLVYKHWLNAALFYLFYASEVDFRGYRTYLHRLAQAFFFDRYTANTVEEYFQIIYLNSGVSKNKAKGNYDMALLDKGTEVENFAFNYLDYILWKERTDRWKEFEFSFRSSVEHYYPRNPIAPEHRIDSSIYDLFGNLCLISSSKNSRLSNHMPSGKQDFYKRVGIDSLKQSLMMNEPEWAEDQIRLHGEAMKYKLKHFVYDE